MPIPERYNSGYNIGVGGAVVNDGRLLMVRRASRRGRGNWQVPGGFIEPEETIEQAVIREVVEEAGVTTEVRGSPGKSGEFWGYATAMTRIRATAFTWCCCCVRSRVNPLPTTTRWTGPNISA